MSNRTYFSRIELGLKKKGNGRTALGSKTGHEKWLLSVFGLFSNSVETVDFLQDILRQLSREITVFKNLAMRRLQTDASDFSRKIE